MSILLLDNYDSFTFNLYQYLAEAGVAKLASQKTTRSKQRDSRVEIIVKRNDEISVADIEKLSPDKIVISPGPGRPEDAGISVEVVKKFYKTIPIFGVCLGHQAISLVFGCKIVKAPQVMHGKTSQITHDGQGVFRGLPNPFVATRYHSLVVDPSIIPDEIVVTAHSVDGQRSTVNGIIMGIRHKDYPVEGVQFHPESVLTEVGKDLIRNFVVNF